MTPRTLCIPAGPGPSSPASAPSSSPQENTFFSLTWSAARSMPAPKVWLITGCSGPASLARALALAALARGDVVACTSRDVARVADLAARGALTFALDVGWADERIAAVVSAVLAKTGGRIDVLVNAAAAAAAGRAAAPPLSGAVEEAGGGAAEALFATAVLGQLNVLRAVLPVMRAQRGGVVANLGGGAAARGGAAESAATTQACAAALSEALRAQVAHLGIRVTYAEPGRFATAGSSSGGGKVVAEQKGRGEEEMGPGELIKAAPALVEALTGTGRCGGRELPARLVLGRDASGLASGYLEEERREMERWKDVATATDFGGA